MKGMKILVVHEVEIKNDGQRLIISRSCKFFFIFTVTKVLYDHKINKLNMEEH